MQALGKRSVASLIRSGLGIAWLLAWILLAGTLFTAIGYAVAAIMTANGALDPAWLHEKANHIRLSNSGSIENYRGPDWLIVYTTLVIAGIGLGGALIVIWRLRKLFDSFLTGDPFRRENAHHLRVIWITMAAVEVTRIALGIFASALLRVFGGPDMQIHPGPSEGPFNIMTWASILILIVLAEVFREGARLKEEQELTI
jgi:hypothetical protein